MAPSPRRLHRRATTLIDQTLRNVRDLVARSPNKSAIARRAALIAANPGLRDSLQVVPAFERVA